MRSAHSEATNLEIGAIDRANVVLRSVGKAYRDWLVALAAAVSTNGYGTMQAIRPAVVTWDHDWMSREVAAARMREGCLTVIPTELAMLMAAPSVRQSDLVPACGAKARRVLT